MKTLDQLKVAIVSEGLDVPVESASRLSWHESSCGLVVDFFGSPFAFGFSELLTLLGTRPYCERLRALLIRGPDEGVNGTRNWDLSPMVAVPNNSFSRLEVLSIEQTAPGDHNESIIGSAYDEDGVLAAIILRAPRLASLTSPSAPNPEFFSAGVRPLGHLNVDTGYDHQNFILNLAHSTCFPSLRSLEFGESSSAHVEQTPLEHYEALLRSGAVSNVSRIVWRNPQLDQRQLCALAGLRRDTQMLVVVWSQQYQGSDNAV